MKKIVVIPARYASMRLPGKPLLEIDGRPVIRLVYEQALKSTLADGVIIATDDLRIAETASAFGAETVMTGAQCRSGTDRCKEALLGREADLIVNLQGDEPFIRPDMIDTLFDTMMREDLSMATLASPINDEREYRDPNVVKVIMDRAGFALYFSRSPIPCLRDAPFSDIAVTKNLVYKHIGIYGFSRFFLETYVTLEKSPLEEAESLEQLRALENGYRIKVLAVPYDGFGIDTEVDLRRARALFGKT